MSEAWSALEVCSFQLGGVFSYYSDIIMSKVHPRFMISSLILRYQSFLGGSYVVCSSRAEIAAVCSIFCHVAGKGLSVPCS